MRWQDQRQLENIGEFTPHPDPLPSRGEGKILWCCGSMGISDSQIGIGGGGQIGISGDILLTGALEQKKNGLVPGQQRHRLSRGESAPVGIAGSNQDVAIAAGEEGFDLLRCRGVVEDKEPVRVGAEPLLDCVNDGGLVGQVFFRQVGA